MASRSLVLIKHAQPILDGATAPRDWRLSTEGESQAARLTERLCVYLPCRLIVSPEPKALRTGEIIAAGLGVSLELRDGLREIDRRQQAIVSPTAHRRINAELFAKPDRRVVGGESADEALDRFSHTLLGEVSATTGNLIAVTHGTVVSLFVAARNDIDAFQLWSDLTCGSYVVLELPALRLKEVSRELVCSSAERDGRTPLRNLEDT